MAAISAQAFIRHQSHRSSSTTPRPVPKSRLICQAWLMDVSCVMIAIAITSGQDARGAGHPDQGAAARLPLQPRPADEPLVDVVGPVGSAPVQVRINGRGERGQHPRQHQPRDAGRQQLGHAPHVGRLPVGLDQLGGERRIGREQDEQPDAERQPEQAAHQDLRIGEDDGGRPRVAVAPAGHRALGQIAAAVGDGVDEPEQTQQRQHGQGDVLAAPRRERQDLVGPDAPRSASGERLVHLRGHGPEPAGLRDDERRERESAERHDGHLADVGRDDAHAGRRWPSRAPRLPGSCPATAGCSRS